MIPIYLQIASVLTLFLQKFEKKFLAVFGRFWLVLAVFGQFWRNAAKSGGFGVDKLRGDGYFAGVKEAWSKRRLPAVVRQDVRQLGLLMLLAGIIGFFLEPADILVESAALAATGLVVWVIAVRIS